MGLETYFQHSEKKDEKQQNSGNCISVQIEQARERNTTEIREMK